MFVFRVTFLFISLCFFSFRIPLLSFKLVDVEGRYNFVLFIFFCRIFYWIFSSSLASYFKVDVWARFWFTPLLGRKDPFLSNVGGFDDASYKLLLFFSSLISFSCTLIKSLFWMSTIFLSPMLLFSLIDAVVTVDFLVPFILNIDKGNKGR